MKDIKYRREEKWWALAHEWWRDVIKVVRTAVWYLDGIRWGIKNYFSGDWGFRTGPNQDIKTRRESTSFGRDGTGWGIKNYFSGDWGLKTGGDHDIKHLFADEKPIDIKLRLTEEKQFDIKWRREMDFGFRTKEWLRTGPSIFAITKTGGIIKTGSRTSEDFRQEDWFRVGGEGMDVRWGGGEGAKTGDFYRVLGRAVTFIREGLGIKTRKTGGWDARGGGDDIGYVPWNRLAHTNSFRLCGDRKGI